MKEMDTALLDILICPKCRGSLTHELDPPSLVCEVCRLRYEIREGIPILLIHQAQPLEDPVV